MTCYSFYFGLDSSCLAIELTIFNPQWVRMKFKPVK